ncbi:hypothetical protein ED312_08540 [Sinomicrobium pectinilyticum]|uniref:Uncharacterized protein n=1 Tax=Sinomicrobium pectinilyticum TaxID=1084421 RepID=A0A3N0EKR6_SINP1|nr:PilN domain-containing protein [Sinomicrobium pectinilyticum]RNL88486.1 hypothetical protein ED312_08540 [Sinomicrobium pectinilyticum]
MIRDILTYLREGHIFQALELSETSAGTGWISTVVKRQKDEILITESGSTNAPDDLPDTLSAHHHTLVIINTNNILTRITETTGNADIAIVNKAFPNIKIDDFYYEVVPSGERAFIAICRKAYIDRILGELKDKGYTPSGFSLGLLCMQHLAAFTGNGETGVSNARVIFADGLLADIRKEETVPGTTYTVNGLEIPGPHLPGFVAVLGLITGNTGSISNFSDRNTYFRQEFYHRRFFRLFVRSALVFLLVLLLANFMVFNHYFGKTEVIKQASEVNRLNRENFMKLKEEVDKKEKVVGDIRSSSGSRSSYYTDRIIQALPASILLKELRYQPLQKQIREGQEVLLQEDRIMISGESADSNRFSEWIENLEAMNWTENVSIRDYGSSASGASFSIMLTIKNNP